MWIMTRQGLLSIVSDRDRPGSLLVRARQEGLIEAFLAQAGHDGAGVWHDGTADYPFRCRSTPSVVADALQAEVLAIDYTNFKASVEDEVLAGLYHQVWEVMAELGSGLRPSATLS